MCQTCATTQTFDPARHDSGASFAEFLESADAAASAATSYSITAGDSFAGVLSETGDRDWVRVTLVAGESYEIRVTGATSGDGSLEDSFLRLYDVSSGLISSDDDGGNGLESTLSHLATRSGTYYISVGAFEDSDSGSYLLSLDSTASEPDSPRAAGTLDEMAEYLTDGYWSDTDFLRGAFDTSDSNQITVDISGLTADGQQLARWAFEAWELVADLEFVETRSGSADMLFDDDDRGAYASSLRMEGEITSAEVNVSQNWVRDYGATISSYTFSTYVHEIGHALGLGHQGNYNGNATYGTDETFANDSYQLSVMSYFSQEDNTSVTGDYADPVSAMMVDIVAIQALYGAPGSDSQTAGDTVWGANTTLTGYLADVFEGLDGSPNANLGTENIALTLYDRDGNDLIDLSKSDTDNRLDLNQMGISDIGGLTGNMMIARDTVIEDARLGVGNDSVSGNEADNTILAGRGDDSLTGGSGNDTLKGGGGDDTLAGDAGRDRLIGGGGGDRLEGGGGNDILKGGGGADSFIFQSAFGRDRIKGYGKGDDRLEFSTDLTEGLTSAAAVVDRFASQVGNHTEFDFGAGNVLKLVGYTDLSSLVDDILFL